ncbi:hypothetical protein BTA51_01095 [Hahella sp. CCB-MM4]|uniref:DUF3601 domain-containing protein n=1 Tax=Hahella sp. (strain CCB-MM4) TaxID=1926491 RepID=UPI000B9C49D7|nr:DUF3601 domain-containing protein [Hahella sp. CCB-MM4]OZG75028.1 hypothetical protein BTA51_01095 [Hahella sp. CCB-MM4]
MERRNLSREYGHLKAGQKYTIAKPFKDYDNNVYEESLVIEFIGSNFVPYDDGLSLFCVYKGRERQIRLQVRPEAQQEVVHNLQQYLVPVIE